MRAAVLAVLLCLAAAAPASAFTVQETARDEKSISGSGCRGYGAASIVLPADARNARVVEPKPGAALEGLGVPVATVLLQAVNGRVAGIGAAGSHLMCTVQDLLRAPWVAVAPLVVTYEREVPVGLPTSCSTATRRRPSAVRLTCSASVALRARLADVRWSSWDGTTAAGRGTLHVTRRRGRSAAERVVVTASQPVRCGDAFQYRSIRIQARGLFDELALPCRR